ncbi:cobalt-precorrin-5B (C(1))-methyltransferase [Pleurocapsales cyanobacterium LEGE 10410]|nr:cobalt-precorrin-5B (C(1))-methyltransferase [Pleurocapsales cyanobacterium LEGE 10410]
MTTGYTLPVFACASAIAALHHLHQQPAHTVTVSLIKPARQVDLDIEQVAKIDDHSAIAITRSDPGDHLDLTRNTPVWAKVSLSDSSAKQITIEGGEGIGRQSDRQAAIYSYAQELIEVNLRPLLQSNESILVTIILPEGTRLAKRTSNEAFGVVEGLSLLGTTGIVQPLIAPSQLEAYQMQIKAKAARFNSLVFCIGENGIDLAQKSGIDPQRIIKTANWLGSMLVTAGAAEIESILLFGYHGKLIKLAGGIFHTHNHLADGRLEIFTAYCARLGLPQSQIEQIFNCSTTESALNLLRKIEFQEKRTNLVDLVYEELARAIDLKSQEYIYKYTEQKLRIGSVLFDRRRRIIKKSNNAMLLLSDLC